MSSVTRFGKFLDFGHFLKPLATINVPKSPTFLGIFCKCVKIFHFSCETIFWATFIDICQFSSGHTGCESAFIYHTSLGYPAFPGMIQNRY